MRAQKSSKRPHRRHSIEVVCPVCPFRVLQSEKKMQEQRRSNPQEAKEREAKRDISKQMANTATTTPNTSSSSSGSQDPPGSYDARSNEVVSKIINRRPKFVPPAQDEEERYNCAPWSYRKSSTSSKDTSKKSPAEVGAQPQRTMNLVQTSSQCGQSNPLYIEINNGLDESVSSLELSTSDRDAIAYLGGLRRRHNAILLEETADKVNEQPNAARSATRRRRATVSGSIPSLLTANKMNVDHDLIAETQAYQRMKHLSDRHQVQQYKRPVRRFSLCQ